LCRVETVAAALIEIFDQDLLSLVEQKQPALEKLFNL